MQELEPKSAPSAPSVARPTKQPRRSGIFIATRFSAAPSSVGAAWRWVLVDFRHPTDRLLRLIYMSLLTELVSVSDGFCSQHPITAPVASVGRSMSDVGCWMFRGRVGSWSQCGLRPTWRLPMNLLVMAGTRSTASLAFCLNGDAVQASLPGSGGQCASSFGEFSRCCSPARLPILNLGGLDHGVPSEFRQRFLPGRFPLFWRRNDNALVAGRALDLPSGQGGLTFNVLPAVDAGELEVGLHGVLDSLFRLLPRRSRGTNRRKARSAEFHSAVSPTCSRQTLGIAARG